MTLEEKNLLNNQWKYNETAPHGYVQKDILRMSELPYMATEEINPILYGLSNPDDTFIIIMNGDTMIDDCIKNGDFLYIDTSKQPKHGDIILAYVDGEMLVRYLYLNNDVDDDHTWLISANKKYSPIRIEKSNYFKIVGVVVKSERIIYGNISHAEHIDNHLINANYKLKKYNNIGLVNVPSKSFVRCIINKNNITSILLKLHACIDGKKGKEVAKVIKVAIEMQLITKPTFNQLSSEFHYIGSRQGYTKYMSYKFYEEEIHYLREMLAE